MSSFWKDRESHRVKPFAFPQSEDLELILEVERGVKLFTDLDFFEYLHFHLFFPVKDAYF